MEQCAGMLPLDTVGTVCTNEQVGPKLFIASLAAPAVAQSIKAGQFVHLALPDMEAHILRRPFSVYAAEASTGHIDILYQEVGFGTSRMTRLKPGDTVGLLGPLGTAWSVPAGTERALLVAGGVGAAPLFMLADSLVGQGIGVDVILGAQTKAALVCHDRYKDLVEASVLSDHSLSCSTDDGSFGYAGFCTSLVEEALACRSYGYAAVCGPEPMMKIAVARIREAGVEAQVSLERRMACGIGACLSCVVETTEGLMRACADGPVFPAEEVRFA